MSARRRGPVSIEVHERPPLGAQIHSTPANQMRIGAKTQALQVAAGLAGQVCSVTDTQDQIWATTQFLADRMTEYLTAMVHCQNCGGHGKVANEVRADNECPVCAGSGFVPK